MIFRTIISSPPSSSISATFGVCISEGRSDSTGRAGMNEAHILHPTRPYSQPADVLGFLCTSTSHVYWKWPEKEKKYSELWTSHHLTLMSIKNRKNEFRIWTVSQKLEVKHTGKMSLVWSSLILGFEFGLYKLKTWIHDAFYQMFRLVVVV